MLFQGERLGPSFSILQVEIQFSISSTICRRGYLFSNVYFGLFCQESDDCSCLGLCQDLYSIDLYVCICDSTMLFLLQWLYSIV
jgi:hypothetical protein